MVKGNERYIPIKRMYDMKYFLMILFTGFTLNAGPLEVKIESTHKHLSKDTSIPTYYVVKVKGKKSDAVKAPLNIALLIDRSKSMDSQKLQQLKLAAEEFIKQLNKSDRLAIISYASNVRIEMTSRLMSDKSEAYKVIKGIKAKGSSALFAGMSKAHGEIKKAAKGQALNRIIILSASNADTGPRSSSELISLAKSFADENISISTIAIGKSFNPYAMNGISAKASGNYYNADIPAKLPAILSNELMDLKNAVASKIKVSINVSDKLSGFKVLNKESKIEGADVFTNYSQIYNEQNREIIFQLKAPASTKEGKIKAFSVNIEYLNPINGKYQKMVIDHNIEIKAAKAGVNKKVMEQVIDYLNTFDDETAVWNNNIGNTKNAVEALNRKGKRLSDYGQYYSSPSKLKTQVDNNKKNIDQLQKGVRWSYKEQNEILQKINTIRSQQRALDQEFKRAFRKQKTQNSRNTKK